jgi:hypothetical protein
MAQQGNVALIGAWVLKQVQQDVLVQSDAAEL